MCAFGAGVLFRQHRYGQIPYWARAYSLVEVSSLMFCFRGGGHSLVEVLISLNCFIHTHLYIYISIYIYIYRDICIGIIGVI